MTTKRFKSASFNNRRRQLSLTYYSGKRICVHYSSLGIKANVQNIWIDKETRGKSIGIKFDDGKKDYLPYDQPLFIAKDPEYLLQNHIEVLISQIRSAMGEKRISKRHLAEQLHTSDNQIQRLLNPKILNKNLFQLYQIGALLGFKMELKAA